MVQKARKRPNANEFRGGPVPFCLGQLPSRLQTVAHQDDVSEKPYNPRFVGHLQEMVVWVSLSAETSELEGGVAGTVAEQGTV